MPSVIARDSVAADHLVYAWPFPIGPEELEVSCADDELVVMCPAWMVGNCLGPGRHRWRTPDPMRPVSAFFVLTAPVEVSFDMMTSFVLPTTGQPVRLRTSGSLQVRCADPALLVAQFVGLPFDHVNDGILRSVSRSIERMLARLLTRRVVMAGTPIVVTDASMHANILEELVAYNPAAGAVFGVELMRMGHLSIYADDGSQPFDHRQSRLDPNGETARGMATPTRGMATPAHALRDDIPMLETVRSPPRHVTATTPEPSPVQAQGTPPPPAALAERAPTPPPPSRPPVTPATHVAASGEIVVKTNRPKTPPPVPPPIPSAARPEAVHGEITPRPMRKTPARIEVQSADESTQPGVDSGRSPVPSGIRIPPPPLPPLPAPSVDEPRGAILGIGTGAIGEVSARSVASGEIRQKIAPGARVLVPGPNGLMQSATVRQLLQGYYELEVGSSGETIWVPVGGVVPE